MAAPLPLMVDLDGRCCLVVGGGEVATRKVLTLLDAGARVTVASPHLAAPLAELHEAGRIDWRPGPYAGLRPAPPEGPWMLVVAATDDPERNERVAADAEAAGTWANVATRPDGGGAAFAATWRSGPITAAVSTSGIHPGAGRWLRDRLAAAIGPEPATALELVAELRDEEVAAGGPGRRPDWRAAVDSGMLDHIRAGQLAEAKERLEACLSSSSD
ncbi:MAG: bifunctional precorrin-2 dehydrogenase/sirohydrochlorin ferrochelatase [Acidimicrobiales bacterium]|nr:bifunctional precorrin-2 dehydrogenase/sirohydrochlorin ferrochelatase [Acidimicrobiales bacterium]